MNLAADIRDPSHIDLLDKALASVRRMCVDYAAAQTVLLRAERDQLISSLNLEKGAGTLLLAERDALASQRDALLTLLADARPLVKGRLLDSAGPHGDASLLARIDDALAATAVRTDAVPGAPSTDAH